MVTVWHMTTSRQLIIKQTFVKTRLATKRKSLHCRRAVCVPFRLPVDNLRRDVHEAFFVETVARPRSSCVAQCLELLQLHGFYPLNYGCRIFVDWVVSLSRGHERLKAVFKFVLLNTHLEDANAVELAIKWRLTNWQLILNELVVE